MLRVDRGRLTVADAEEFRVETTDVVDEAAPPGYRPAGHPRLRVVVLIDVPPVRRDLGDQIVAAQQRLPQQFGGVDAAGQAAGHSNHRNGCDLGFSHKGSFAFRMSPRGRAPRRHE